MKPASSVSSIRRDAIRRSASIQAGDRELVVEVIVERLFFGRDRIRGRSLPNAACPNPAFDQSSCADGPPAEAPSGAFRRAVVLVDVVGAGIEFAAGLVGAVGLVQPHLFAFFGGAFRRLGFGTAFVLGAHQKRVTLDLGLDVFGKLDVGELKQLDGLLQLRRHDKGLTLSQLQAMRERHRDLPWPGTNRQSAVRSEPIQQRLH